MKKIIALAAALIVAQSAKSEQRTIIADPKTGNITCTAEPGLPCYGEASGGMVSMCQGRVCFLIRVSPAKESKN